MITSKNLDYEHEELLKQNAKISTEIYHKINSVTKTEKFIKESYSLLLNKLAINEKKSNRYGLSGSLFFQLKNFEVKPKRQYLQKKDSKLMIYDVLKARYDRINGEEKQKAEK